MDAVWKRAVCAAVIGAVGATAGAQPQFTIQEIEYPEASAWIRDINDAGQVPIDAFDQGAGDHNAYVWQDGVLTPLPSHPLSESVIAYSIDENGVVYGTYVDPNAQRPTIEHLPMRWVDGVPEDLPLASDTFFASMGRSSATTGVVAGSAGLFAVGTPGWTDSHGWGSGDDAETPFGFDDPRRAVLWGQGERRVLPRMPMGDESRAVDVNDAGQAVFIETLGAENRHWSFLIDPQRGVIDLGTLGVGHGGNGRGTGTYPAAINESGQIVGLSYVGFAAHPFLWEDGVMTDLGVPAGFAEAEATDVNDHGDVVGRMRVQNDPVRFAEDAAFLYTDGVIYNLQDLVPPGSGWRFTRAIAINNNGQILVAERRGDVFSSRYAILTAAP